MSCQMCLLHALICAYLQRNVYCMYICKTGVPTDRLKAEAAWHT